VNWFWLNIPLASVIFLAVAGIPLWMVIKHPDTRPGSGTGRQPARQPAGYGVASPRTWRAASQHRAEQRRAGGQLVSTR
jgi:hypothetical protein